jgi:thymidylate synthase
MLNNIFIKATNLSDAWFQSLYSCIENGRSFTIDRGSYAGDKRLEFDYFTIQITHPGAEPLLPKVNPLLGFPDPVQEGYLDDYLPYLMTAEKKDDEAYTYGQRLTKVTLDTNVYKNTWKIKLDNLINEINDLKDPIVENISKGKILDGTYNREKIINQIELMIWTYKNKGCRNNQMVLQIAQPSDIILKDPPCLRHIDTRIQDDKLHFFPYFRSWDLFGGFPANLAAIELMKQYCADQIGVENGEIIASSKGLHLYSYVWEISEAIRGKEILSDY